MKSAVRLALAALAAFALFSRSVPAQTACQVWNDGFGTPSGANGQVLAAAVFDAGTGPEYYIAGQFTQVGGEPAPGIAKWNGSEWTPLPSIPGVIYSMAVFDDGQGSALYAAGTSGIRKWTGSSWTTISTSITNNVLCLCVFDDGGGPALYAGGAFDAINGIHTGPLAKWDGSSWTGLGSTFAGTPTPIVYAMTVFDDGTGPALIAGGDFASAGGGTVNELARWDGQQWSALGGGVGGRVWALGVYDDGSGAKLYAGGEFLSAGGVPASRIACWDGASWSALGTGVSGGPTHVSELAVFDAGAGPQLFVGGAFTSAGGSTALGLAAWDGSSWSNAIHGFGNDVTVLQSIDLGSGPLLAICCDTYSTYASAFPMVLQGAHWATLDPRSGAALSTGALALCEYDDGAGPALYAGGEFQGAGGLPAHALARWDEQSWSPVRPDEWSGAVHALHVLHQPGGDDLFAGGALALIGGSSRGIIRLHNGHWNALGAGLANGTVKAIEVYDSGSGPEVYAGGSFTLVGGVPTPNIGRWDGSAWHAVGAGVNGEVRALAVFDDGSGPALYLGGTFSNASGVAVNALARWNGSSFAPLGSGTNNHVYSLAVWDDGSGPALYAGGYFTSAGGVPANGIARWDGSNWSALGSGVTAPPNTPGVVALAAFDAGSGPALYCGGDFTQAGGQPAVSLARWNGTTWSAVGNGLDARVDALASAQLGSGPGLFASGIFQHAGAVLSDRLAEWRGCDEELTRLCFGDGHEATCPCGNNGLALHGCENSAGTGGAVLNGSGSPALDTLLLQADGTLPSATTIYIQSRLQTNVALPWGDGLRCAGGTLLRLYVKSASSGASSAPGPGDPSIRARSLALGDPLPHGGVRIYQAVYRDPSTSFCPAPAGGLLNATNAVRVVW